MQPFPAGLARVRARWYTSPVPVPSRSRTPGPLANLPRPLDERGRGRARGRRVATIAGLATIIGLTGAIALAVLPAVVSPVGEVAGAVATVHPDPTTGRSGPPHGASPVVPTLPPTGPGPAPGPVVVDAAVDLPVGRHPPVATALPASLLTGYRWPLAHGRITLPFGPTGWGTRVVDGELFHDGIDLATFCGDRVVAAHAGKVLAVGRHFDDAIGWVGSLKRYYARLDAQHLWYELPIMVVIDDGNGYRSMYAHFGDVAVKRGQIVKAGQFLGHEGRTGRATGCHVHFGLFSPYETATFGIEPGVVKRMKVPSAQVARIDPLLVLPDRNAPPPSSAKPGTDQPISP
jgi:Peptidase family M23